MHEVCKAEAAAMRQTVVGKVTKGTLADGPTGDQNCQQLCEGSTCSDRFILCVCVLPAYTSMHCVCAVSMEARRGCQTPEVELTQASEEQECHSESPLQTQRDPSLDSTLFSAFIFLSVCVIII